MAGDELPTSLTRLNFHGPLSEARAGCLVDRLTRARPATVLDVGCGWGELMLRILAALPDATGLGFDTDERDLARARDAARARGLDARVTFVNESGVGTTRGPADPVLCVGASHALSEAWIETATLEEWEEFESGYQCDEEEWLASHAGHPEAARIRAQVDEHRSYWLRGYRGILGQAYLTLVPVG
jgi:hypothetical protein